MSVVSMVSMMSMVTMVFMVSMDRHKFSMSVVTVDVLRGVSVTMALPVLNKGDGNQGGEAQNLERIMNNNAVLKIKIWYLILLKKKIIVSTNFEIDS